MASEILVSLCDEVTCPICLELLSTPLSLECGHSFCQVCITKDSNKSTNSSEEQDSYCPMCRVRYQLENLRPNRHLGNIVQRFREVKVSLKKEENKPVCEKHKEKLLLFCKNDGMVICWLCERSQEHKGHKTLLVEEVTEEYKVQLQKALERLKREQEKAMSLKNDIRKEKALLKNQLQTKRKAVQTEFDNLRGILDRDEQKELQKLQKEEENLMSEFEEGENDLVQQSQMVGELISEVEHRMQASAIEMLQDVRDLVQRSTVFTVKRSKTFPKEQRSVFQALSLTRMLQVFRELTDAQQYWVNMTLKSIGQCSNVVISDGGRQATVSTAPTEDAGLMTSRGNNFQMNHRRIGICSNKKKLRSGWNINNAIRGSLFIKSGKHYWEVDVSRKTEWVLGVFNNQRIEVNMEEFGASQDDYYGYQPQHSYWVIGLRNQYEYFAFESSLPLNQKDTILRLNVPPCRIGVFLDYESGTVSFFNITNHGCLIYKFSNRGFSPAVCPYFNLMGCAVPMLLCPPATGLFCTRDTSL